MAAVTPARRMTAEVGAGYSMIASPDGKKYESATAELGNIFEPDEAESKIASENSVNVLAEDPLKMKTVLSQVFNRDAFIEKFLDSECADDIDNAITLSSSDLKTCLESLGRPSGARTRLMMTESGPSESAKLNTEEIDLILVECSKLTRHLISTTVLPKIADLIDENLMLTLPTIKISDMTEDIDRSKLRDPMENEFISIIHTIMPLLKTCTSLEKQALTMKEKIISNDSLRNLLAGELACMEPGSETHVEKIAEIKKIEEQSVQLQDHWDSIKKTQLGLKNDIHAHVIRYTGNVAPPKKSEKVTKPFALPGGSAGTPDPKLAKKITLQ